METGDILTKGEASAIDGLYEAAVDLVNKLRTMSLHPSHYQPLAEAITRFEFETED